MLHEALAKGDITVDLTLGGRLDDILMYLSGAVVTQQSRDLTGVHGEI